MLFGKYAPLYWAANLNAIPLHPKRKSPIPHDWSRWNQEKLPDELKASWLRDFPDANIGIPPGSVSNLCFIDIDVYDPVLLAQLEGLLPTSPWRRVGLKGCVLAFKWCDIPSFKINESKASLMQRGEGAKKVGFEFFGSSGQVVMPPSIHPDTGRAYVSNCNLWEVIDNLPSLDAFALERKAREVLKEYGVRAEPRGGKVSFATGVSQGSRDNTMIKMAGGYAYDIRRGLITLREALDYMQVWCEEQVEYVEGDAIDASKGQQRIVEFLVRDVHERNAILPKGWDASLDEETIRALGLGVITQESVSMDFAEIRGGFEKRLGEIEKEGGDQLAKQMIAVDVALRQLARSKNVTDIEIDGLFLMMQQYIGKEKIRVNALRKGLKRYQNSASITGESHSEIAEEVLKDLHDVEIRYDRGTLWEWQGSFWKQKSKDELLSHIIKNYGNFPAAKRASDHDGIVKTVARLVAQPIKTRHNYGINFTNGFLGTDLRLLRHDREFGLTYQLPYKYVGEMANPVKFVKFLRESFPDDVLVTQLVQEALAVTLFGLAPKYQRCFLAHGVPNSGKSTLMEIVEGLFPAEAQTAIPPNKWDQKYVVSGLDGPILNLAGELPEKRLIDSQYFKQIINGEPLTGEHKYRDPFTFRPTAAHWFASNHLPKTEDVSAAFIRRWMILSLKYTVPEEKRNILMAYEILLEEREQIVAWAVQALPSVTERGFLIMPPSCAVMLAELAAALNPIRLWLREKVKMVAGELTEEQGYQSYKTWNLQKGFRLLERGVFRATMREEAGGGKFICDNNEDGNQVYHGLRINKNTV